MTAQDPVLVCKHANRREDRKPGHRLDWCPDCNTVFHDLRFAGRDEDGNEVWTEGRRELRDADPAYQALKAKRQTI